MDYISEVERCKNIIPTFFYEKQLRIIQKLEKTFEKLGHDFFKSGKFNVNLIGIRNNVQRTNTYNDLFLLIYRNQYNVLTLEWFPFSADPGTYYLDHPVNVEGTAFLPDGQYKSTFILGKHKSYPALVQAKPIKVLRYDQNHVLQDELFDATGINIHHAGDYKNFHDPTVDRWSAGCQVLQYKEHHEHLINICQLAKNLYGKYFTYTLINEYDIT
jgi:hypothetical protein